MSDTNNELSRKILALKSSVERAGTLRAQAETSLQHAKQDVAKIDEQLKGLGVDPDKAEQEVALMEQTLGKKLDQIQTLVNTEIEAYNKVVDASKQVFA